MTREAAVQTQTNPTSHPLSQNGILQRKCMSCGQHILAGSSCDKCQEENRFELTLSQPLQLNQDFSRIPTKFDRLTHLQRKPRIGHPTDKYEQEADRIAGQIVNMPSLNQRDVKESIQISSQAPQTAGIANNQLDVPRIVHEVLRTPGQPIDQANRNFMESRFGLDFSQVRLHTDSKAAESASAINARAYTSGIHIAFGKDQHGFSTSSNRHLLAHELVHVVQQSQAFLPGQKNLQHSPKPPFSAPSLIQRTPGAGVDRVELDCERKQITFYQNNVPFVYRLIRCRNIEARTYQATVSVATNYLLIPPASPHAPRPRVSYRLNNSQDQGNPFALFGEQSTVEVIVWSGRRVSEPSHDDSSADSDTGELSGEEPEGPEAEDREPSDESDSGEGRQRPERRAGVRFSSRVTEEQRQIVIDILRQIHGHREDPNLPAVDTYISMADIRALLRLAAHPNFEGFIQQLRSGGQHRPDDESDIDYNRMIDILIAQHELSEFGDQFDFEFSSSSDAPQPLVARPVHGHIVPLSDNAVPGKEAEFEFQIEDNVDLFAVPHVFIRWFAARRFEGQVEPDVVERETLNYIEVNPDGLLNDRQFEVAFSEPGNYEIHAFVLHSFFLPNHFSIQFEVKTEQERLNELENAEDEERVLQEPDTTRAETFEDVAEENQVVQLGIGIVGLGPGLVTLLLTDDQDAEGIRREGTLDPSQVDPGSALRHIEQQQERVRTLRDQYRGNDETELLEWAEDRLAQLARLRRRLSEQLTGEGRSAVLVEGGYISRQPGVRSGHLRLVSWFTYNSNTHEYSAKLVDYSELVRNQHFEFEAEGSDFENVYERLFFLLSSTYPNGRMRFSFQKYEGTRGTDRYIQFERVTDTLLNDIQETVFSQPVSLVVNVTAAILTVFPPTAPVGIGIGLIYNGADTALNFMDAQRSGTVTSANYVDLGLLAVDIIPLLGRAFRLGRTGMYVLRVGAEVTELAGNAYVFSAQAFEQINELRNGDVQQLADLQSEVNTLIQEHAPPEEIRAKQAEIERLQRSIRDRAELIFLEMAATQGLQIVSQRGAAHLAHQAGIRRGLIDPDAPSPDAPTREFIDEGDSLRARPDDEPSGLLRRPAGEPTRTPRTAELASGLPPHLRDVEIIDSGGDHNSVRVRAEYGIFGVKRIRVEAGRRATAADIADHTAAIELYRGYQGVSGSIRSAMEYASGIIQGLPPEAVRAGREIQGEIDKLPDIIARRGRELEAQRGAMTPEQIAIHEEQIRDLEAQLAEHRSALARLNTQSQSRGYIAALDRVLEGMDREIRQSIPPGETRAARDRLSIAQQIISRFRRRGEGNVDFDSSLLAETSDRIRGFIQEMVFDPIFGRLALLDVQRSSGTERDPTVQRRTRTLTDLQTYAERLLGYLEAADQSRRQRHESSDVTGQAIAAHRARPDVPDTDGTVAAGVLFVDDSQGQRQQVGGVMLGASSQAATTDVPIDPRYRRRRQSGETETFGPAIDHAEQTVVGRAHHQIAQSFPGRDPTTIEGELRLQVEQSPCFNCLAGLEGQHKGSGPLNQFSREYPGIRIVITFANPSNPSETSRMIIQNGVIIDE